MSTGSQPEARPQNGDLSVTALYTSATWSWANLPYAEIFIHRDSRIVFGITNVVLAVARIFVRGAGSLRHALVHRHVLIDRLVDSAGVTLVVELAAGLSRRGAAFSANPNIRYVEFDLPHVIARKQALLAQSSVGRAVAARSNYEIHPADVINECWEDTVRSESPRVVVAEGLLMYLNSVERLAFYRRVADYLEGTGGALVFDLVPKNERVKPGAIGRWLGWLMRRFTDGAGFDEASTTRESIIHALQRAGFDSVEALEPYAVADKWNLPFREHRTEQLVFWAKKHRNA